jgi:MioC protein
MSKHFEIIVGTMLGAAEYVADAIAEILDASGHTHTIHAEPNLDEIKTESTWIVCTSTHGAGELPDNIQPFAKQLEGADLSAVNAYVIGLGDTSYDTFCFGAKEMEKHIWQISRKYHNLLWSQHIPLLRSICLIINWNLL